MLTTDMAVLLSFFSDVLACENHPTSNGVFPGGELMALQHVLGGLRHDVAELARVRGDDLDHPSDHLSGIEVSVGRL